MCPAPLSPRWAHIYTRSPWASSAIIVSDTQRNRLQIYNKVKNYTTAARTL